MVQPLPPQGVGDLNGALLRLARNSEDVSALLDAGTASLKLGDHDAAIGFFSRADSISGGNAKAKAGLASAFVRGQNPYDALLMFDEAERAGADKSAIASDRGLAYDLVGDNLHAQELYRTALAAAPSDEVSRRLALSLAVSGDRAGSEAALRALLERRDLAAFRTRAFALAILGDVKEAQAIANVRLMPEMASRLGPYLRYMPRLTPAQQVAAANFGRFPKAADVGKDDPRIAARSGARKADAPLIPKGEPLGRKARPLDEKQDRKRQDKETQAVIAKQTAPSAPAPAVAQPRPPAPPAPVPTARPASAAAAQVPRPPASATVYGPPASALASATQLPAPTPALAPRQVSAAPAPVPAPRPAAAVPAPAPTPPAPVPVAAPAPRARVADAFADLALPQGPARPAEGAVDVTKIQVKRAAPAEAKAEAKPEAPPAKVKAKAPPPPPKHPSRIWVQIGTGRDKDALAFDWRRYNRQHAKLFKGKTAYLAQWGRTNRLLTGPFPSDKAAQAFLAELKKADIGSFGFTSKEGEQVDPLD